VIVARTQEPLEAAAKELAQETGRRIIAIPADTAPRRHDFFLPDIPAPPLHIRYLTLLI